MKIFTSKIVVLRYSRNWDSWQDLVKRWYIGPVRIWPTIVDTELIPRHVHIAYRCFGDCGEWRSKFNKILRENAEAKKKCCGFVKPDRTRPAPPPRITEGKAKKGCTNEKPTTPRPPAPRPQGARP